MAHRIVPAGAIKARMQGSLRSNPARKILHLITVFSRLSTALFVAEKLAFFLAAISLKYEFLLLGKGRLLFAFHREKSIAEERKDWYPWKIEVLRVTI
jgi:hypothetical protein